MAIDLVGWGIVLPILPLYAEHFTTSKVTIGLLVAVFSLMQLVFAPIWGRVSDRVGRKPVLVVSLAGTAVGSLLMGIAPTLPILFLGRIIDGISGGSISTAHAAVTDMAAPGQRARLIGLLGAAFGIGFVIGPAIGGLAALEGRHLPFFVAAAIAGINALVAIRRLPETRPVRVEPAPEVAARPRPAVSGTLLQLVLVVFVATSAFTAFEATFALLGNERFGLTIAGTSGVFVLVGLFLAFFQGGMVHPIVARYGELATVRGGLGLNVVGFLLLAGADDWLRLGLALALITAGQGLLSPALTSMVAGRARDDRRGAVLGVQQSASALARVVGPILGTALFGHVGLGAPYAVGAGLAAAAALLTMGVGPDVRAEVTAG
ncbi:MAG: transporter, family, tetracycline resistance protein [Actinomycetota bacterium]|nr:transporter, family, tetracycline resistance protein [Actinomycetota bacterium]